MQQHREVSGHDFHLNLSDPVQDLSDRWSVRRMMVLVSAVSLFAWAAVVVYVFDL